MIMCLPSSEVRADAVHPNGDQAGRPRERLLQYGAHTLTDAELVSLLLSAGANPVQVAQRLLETVGGIPAWPSGIPKRCAGCPVSAR
jgi:hypothetical protein